MEIGNKIKTKKVDKKAWDTAIRKARGLVQSYDKNRWTICQLAQDVCDLSHGGKKTAYDFSLKNFADLIEIDRHTLYEWIRIKKNVYDKLPQSERNKNHKYVHYKDTMDLVGSDQSPSIVRAAFRKCLDVDPAHRKFKKYSAHLSGLLYNAIRPVMLAEIDEHVLIEIIQQCEQIAKFLNKELEYRQKTDPKNKVDLRLVQMEKKKEIMEKINKQVGELN